MTREAPGEPAGATPGEATREQTGKAAPLNLAPATLEAAGVAHAAAMAAIHRLAFPPSEVWGTDAIALQLALPGVIGWLDRRGGMILARVAADEVEVLTLAVAPAARRLGLGTRLLDAAMTLAASHGARTAFLEVSVGNPAARMLYARAGFTPTGRRPRYYADGTDALVLRRTLFYSLSPCGRGLG
jgi:[ribosomal protein S18]-alanine N-acetyltransferase